MSGTKWRGSSVLALVLVVGGCASHTAPERFLPTPEQAQTDGYGGWIELGIRQGNRRGSVKGELVAVTRDSVWVLGDTGAVVAVATATVHSGKLTGYNSRWGAVAGYTALGVLSTISNGWLLIFTAPTWVITGTVAGANESHAPQRKTPPLDWPDLAVFARFPQGLPAGLRLGELRPKPR